MLQYLIGGNLCGNQNFQDRNPELTVMIILKFVYIKRVEKRNMKNLFRSLCNQVLINSSMVSHILSKVR